MLSPGTTIGRFEIVEKIGSGGMGEVWKATDTSLGRSVALKALPDSLSGDRERLSRLEREARLLASLSHPNIAAIYGLEKSGDVSVLELELISGQTLLSQLESGPVPVRSALEIALQIVNALEAAHKKGVIHRDLKPGNIMLTADGIVKVLDFGLGKTLARELASEQPAAMPTASMTQQGKLLGTPAYMSPEQARGEHVDQQTDVWAFGCVLFELLSGFSPFARATPTETLGKVLEREPDFGSLPEETPAAARRLLRRCLEKDHRNRLHDISDARLELLDALNSGTAESEVAVEHGRRSWLLTGAVGVLALSTAILTWLILDQSGQPGSPGRQVFASGPSFRPPVIVPGNRVVALSPDGSRIAEATGVGIRIRAIRNRDVVIVSGGPTNAPAFSTDGEWIAFIDNEGLRKASVFNGVPETLATSDELGTGRTLGVTWSADMICVATQQGIFRVAPDPDGAEPEFVFPAPDDRSIAWPEMLPGGESMLLTVHTGNSFDQAYVAMLDLNTGQLSGALVRGVSARFVPSEQDGEGHIVYATSSGRLAVIGFDAATGRVSPGAATLTDVEVSIGGSYLSATFDVADNGLLAHIEPYIPFITARGSRLFWIDRDGGEQLIDVDIRTWFD